MLNNIKKILKLIGARQIVSLILFFSRLPQFIIDYIKFRKLKRNTNRDLSLKLLDFYPVLNEATAKTSFDRHYVFHTSWAARKVKQINPEVHIDISSSLYFCGILSAFQSVEFYDYRPADLNLDNLVSKRVDIHNLPFPSNSVKSLSCMHVVEHIGLGRYGDKLDFDGDLRAIDELKRVVATKGNLIFVVPIGIQRICFNAHRVYNHDTILTFFCEFKLKEFQLIETDMFGGTIIPNPSKTILNRQTYACGLYWFEKC